MKDDLNLKHFLRDWSGTCIHFHAQGNEGRHEEFLSEFMKFRVSAVLLFPFACLDAARSGKFQDL